MSSLNVEKGDMSKEYIMPQQRRYDDDDDRRGCRTPCRDEEGRFMSSGRGGSRPRHDDDGRGNGRGGWFGDPEGHSEAARRGWRNR